MPWTREEKFIICRQFKTVQAKIRWNLTIMSGRNILL